MPRHREPGNGLAYIGIGISSAIGLALFINFIDTGVNGKYFDYLLPWIYWLFVIPAALLILGGYMQSQRNKPLD